MVLFKEIFNFIIMNKNFFINNKEILKPTSKNTIYKFLSKINIKKINIIVVKQYIPLSIVVKIDIVGKV